MKAYWEDNTKYYKYTYSSWTQPTLTSNGIFGGNSMAVTITFGSTSSHDDVANTYKIFKPNTDRVGFYCNEYQSWMEVHIYLPKPTKLTTLTFLPVYVGSSSGGSYNTKFYGGSYMGTKENLIINIGTVSENTTYNNTNLPTNDYYQYYTLFCNNGGWSHEDALHLKNVYISGQARTVTEGTPIDYDYKVLTGKTFLVKENDIYKALKSYEKGQYYGN